MMKTKTDETNSKYLNEIPYASNIKNHDMRMKAPIGELKPSKYSLCFSEDVTLNLASLMATASV